MTDSRRARRRVRLVVAVLVLAANTVGAVVVAALGLFVIPGPSVLHGRVALVTYIALPVYVSAALVIGLLVGIRRTLGTMAWYGTGRTPTEKEAKATLKVPRRLVAVTGVLWAGAVVLFTLLYGLADAQHIAPALFSISFGAVVVCANVALLTEFGLRPVTALALEVHTPARKAGVMRRTVVAWVLGSAVPLVGLMIVAVFALAQRDITKTRLAVTVLALGAVTIAFGFLLVVIVSRATVRTVRGVRRALAAIGAGDLTAQVTVDDSTELGDLQSGFNEMAAGLRERERVRDLFGRHVGQAVAAAALAGSTALGGEEREVAVVFVDVVGSTTMAESRPATEVVALLNAFFAVVVEEVERHGGLVNKFLGDAALGVFGAPVVLDDPAGSALAAARTLVERLTSEVPGLTVGAGVAAGTAVAGNVGAAERFEYTVIGDPVNQAARLSELAKTGHCLLAAVSAVERAPAQEQQCWEHDRDEVLRGRHDPTAVFRLRASAAADGGRQTSSDRH